MFILSRPQTTVRVLEPSLDPTGPRQTAFGISFAQPVLRSPKAVPAGGKGLDRFRQPPLKSIGASQRPIDVGPAGAGSPPVEAFQRLQRRLPCTFGTQQQGLLQGSLEPVMALLDVAVLVGLEVRCVKSDWHSRPGSCTCEKNTSLGGPSSAHQAWTRR